MSITTESSGIPDHGTIPTPSGKGLDETPCCARFSFVRVTTPGCEGTINLLWDEYPVAWINSVQIASEIMTQIPEHNV